MVGSSGVASGSRPTDSHPAPKALEDGLGLIVPADDEDWTAVPVELPPHPGLTPGRSLVLEIGPRRPVGAALQEDHPIGRDAGGLQLLPGTPAGGHGKTPGQEAADAGHGAYKVKASVRAKSLPSRKRGCATGGWPRTRNAWRCGSGGGNLLTAERQLAG